MYRLQLKKVFVQRKALVKSGMCASASSSLESLGPMTAHHDKLLRQPVPPLGTTLEKYLKAVRPLVTEEEFRHTEKIVEQFGAAGGLGHKLHAVLQERAKKLDNWMGDWWLKMDFLEHRKQLAVYSNVGSFWAKENYSSRKDWLRYAAKVTMALVDFKKLVDLHLLPPDELKGEPLDMNQYFRVFSTCRLPRKGCDEQKLYGQEENPPKHIVVVRNNQYFQVEVYDSEGEPLHESVVFNQLQKIVARANSVGPPLGILTTEKREVWAEIYDRMQKDELNRTSMDIIQRCMFMICLDRPIKYTNKEEPIPDYLHNSLHGGGSQHNSANRWFDKCLQFIVSEDGTVGKCMEHSPAEGYTVVKLIDHICDYVEKEVDWDVSSSSPEPMKLEFNLSPELLKDIEAAEDNLNKLVGDADVGYLMYEKFGKNVLKSYGLSPDGFIQMALQLAFYRLHGLRGVLYEVATMHRFLHGRMEIVHPTTSEAIDFCKAMLNPKATLREKAASLRTAVAAHISSVEEAHRGEGLETILLGLKRAAEETGIKVPKLFEDYGFHSCYNYRVITSQLPMRSKTVITSFGPLSDDGYGCPYHVYKDKIQFVALSFHHRPETNSSNFLRAVEMSLNEMNGILKESGDMSITCEF